VVLLTGEGAALPTAPLGQVLASQGVGVPPVFSPSVLLHLLGSGLGGWKLTVEPGGDFMIRRYDEAGVAYNPRVSIDPYLGGLTTHHGGLAAVNGQIFGSWLSPAQHTYAELMAIAANYVGNLGTISDSTTNTPGAVIAGGGSYNVLARWNGTNWIVISG
jgi:hypothetical protein